MIFATEFSLFRVFSSHMVLQRGKEIVISGHAVPGQTVRVAFAELEVLATADGKSEWYAAFPAMTAGGPWSLTVSGAAGTTPIELEDILIGDVWFCSGQSNMEMPVGGDNPFFRAGDFEETLADADRPQIRLYQSIRRVSPFMANEEETGSWQVCCRKTLTEFSACGFYFGDQYQKDVKVPVGLISCNWGGTRIEPWISPAEFARADIHPYKDPDELPENLQETIITSLNYQILKTWCEKFDNYCGRPAKEELLPEFDDSSWDEWSLPNKPGRYLYRYTFDMPQELDNKEVYIEFGIINDTDESFCNGEFIGSTGIDQPAYWSIYRKYTMRARKGRNCIAIIVDNHCAAGLAPTDNILKIVYQEKIYQLKTKCRQRLLRVLPTDFDPRPEPPAVTGTRNSNSSQYPGTLFNAMVYPWLRYKLAGFLWYQGCSNAGELLYYRMHKLLIDSWRKEWQDADLPFILVQLAGFHVHSPEQPCSSKLIAELQPRETEPYPLTREIQAEMPKVRKNVGMIVAYDRGNHSDIHPRDKKTLGFRLAKKAQQILFGSKEVCDGPEFIGYRQEGDALRVFFKNIGSGLTTSDGLPPKGFVLGDRNGALVKVTDVEIDGNSVVLRGLYDPQRIRYAFTGYCEVNLCNKEGFPAVPFRTDKIDYRYMDADDLILQ